MGTIENAGIIVALVSAIKSLVPVQVHGWVTVLVAAVLGAGLAYLQNADPATGVYNGLLAVGAVTVADRVGK